MNRKKQVSHKLHRHIIRQRSFFILARWMAVSVVLILVVLTIITGGKILPVAGLFFKPTPTPTPDTLNIIPNLSGDNYVNLALKDLSEKLNISEISINIESVNQIDWADSSLGCPKPGKMYAQMVTPGYLIKLKAGNQIYLYHAGLNKVISC